MGIQEIKDQKGKGGQAGGEAVASMNEIRLNLFFAEEPTVQTHPRVLLESYLAQGKRGASKISRTKYVNVANR